jgi:cytochrome c biogenesis protein CcdA/glutaredoxin
MHRQVIKLVLFCVALLIFATTSYAQEPPIFFYGQGCGHCAKVEDFFAQTDVDERLGVVSKEIYFDRENATEFNQLMEKLDIPPNRRGVPSLVVDGKIIIGDQPIINYFNQDLPEEPAQVTVKSETNDSKQAEALTLLMIIGAAIVDAINPCAFAVLIILMTTILSSGQPRRALKAGLAFAASIFISYYLMGIGLYTAIGVSGVSSLIFTTVGVLAIILGLLNIKDFFWYGKGVLMEVPLSWRPRLKKLISSITSPVGAFTTGFLVSLFLLPCTSGPYIVILGMLSQKSTQGIAALYLLLYNLIFVSPMVAISVMVYKGLKPERIEKLRQKNLKVLHLVAGLILLCMGGYVLFFQ